MKSLVLRVVGRAVLPVFTVFALYLLLRGHNEPGGGFIAGLVTASALVLQGLAFGSERTYRLLLPMLRHTVWVGLLMAALTGLWAVALGDPFMTHYHAFITPPWGGAYVHLSTTLIFDVGVYLVVVGVAASLVSGFARVHE